MIVVAGTVRIRPETRAAAVAAARTMAAATRLEPGCVAYRFAFDLDDPDCVHLFEEWTTAEALASHFATPHMAAFQAQLGGLIAAPPAIRRYVVEHADAM